MQLAALVTLAATIVWLTREHLLPTPEVGDEPRPHYRATPPPQPDDLTEVKGIGPVYASRLNGAGIMTFVGLAESDAAATADVIDVPAETVAGWIEQAKAKLN